MARETGFSVTFFFKEYSVYVNYNLDFTVIIFGNCKTCNLAGCGKK